MSEEEEKDRLMCVLADGGPQIPGSAVSTCDMCGRDVYISPSGQKMVKEQNLSPTCIECLRPFDTKPELLTVEQITEIREYFNGNSHAL